MGMLWRIACTQSCFAVGGRGAPSGGGSGLAAAAAAEAAPRGRIDRQRGRPRHHEVAAGGRPTAGARAAGAPTRSPRGKAGAASRPQAPRRLRRPSACMGGGAQLASDAETEKSQEATKWGVGLEDGVWVRAWAPAFDAKLAYLEALGDHPLSLGG